MPSNAGPGVDLATEPIDRRNDRSIAVALVLTYVTLVAFAGLIWLSALQSSDDGVTTSSGARAAIVALSACFILAVFVRSATLWTPRWIPWVGVGITAGFLVVAAVLFQTGRLDNAFAVYGGFQVPRAGRLFSDTHWILNWFSCGFCSEWDPVYGPGLNVLDPLTGSQIGVSWLPFVGVLLSTIALVAIYVLGRASTTLGQWVVALSAASPAWLLLVERANWDILILGCLVGGAVAVTARPTYLTWTAFAIAIWILGTIKTYPFALGVVLLVALGMRWGWVIVGGFLVATTLFTVVFFDSLTRAGGLYSSPELLPYEAGASPAYGRVLLSELLEGLFPDPASSLLTLVLLLGILGLAGWWGWLTHPYREDQSDRTRIAILGLAGATAFLSKALVVGFGFAYAGAALLLLVPAIVVQSGRPSIRNGSMVSLSVLVLLAVFGSFNVVLGTLAGFVVAGFGLGFGTRFVWNIVKQRVVGVGGSGDTSVAV